MVLLTEPGEPDKVHYFRGLCGINVKHDRERRITCVYDHKLHRRSRVSCLQYQ